MWWKYPIEQINCPPENIIEIKRTDLLFQKGIHISHSMFFRMACNWFKGTRVFKS